MDQTNAARLLNKLDCFTHKMGPWREDVEPDDKGRKTESSSCIECGHTQVRRIRR